MVKRKKKLVGSCSKLFDRFDYLHSFGFGALCRLDIRFELIEIMVIRSCAFHATAVPNRGCGDDSEQSRILSLDET